MKIYTSQVLEILDNGDAIIELPEELLKEMSWELGDTLDISEKNGQIHLTNLTKKEDR
jgi:hypothetical protein